MADKTEAEKTEEREPDFSNVVFEGEDQTEPAGHAEGGPAEGDERLGEREGLSATERAGETLEQKQERRRKERAEKKARIKAEREENRELKTELRRLAGMVQELGGKVDTRIGGIEGRQSGYDLNVVDNRMAMLRSSYSQATQDRQKAMTEGNGAAFDAADQKMRESEREYNALAERRKALTADGGTRREQPREQHQEVERPDPRIARLANAFIAEFPDYDPDGSDQDSLVVQALDAAVTAEGFDPKTQEYWDELRDRVLDRIPEWDDQPKRNGKTNGTRPRARATLQGSGREGGGEGGAVKFVVSKERVQAMKDAGIWEDPNRRAKQIEAFRKWDRENPQERAAR